MANAYWLLVSRSKNLKYFHTSNCVCIKFRIPYVIVFYVCVVRILKRTNFFIHHQYESCANDKILRNTCELLKTLNFVP